MMSETDPHHIRLNPPRWDAAYYRDLAESLTALATVALRSEGRSLCGASILEVGCGRGEFMRAAGRAGGLVVGVDVDAACAQRSRQFGPVVVARVENLDHILPAGHFDVVVCSHVLEHVESPRVAVNVMKALSRRWLILAVPNLLRPVNWFLRRPRYVNRGHLHGWDPHHFLTFLEVGCALRVARWWLDAVTLAPLRRTPLLDTRPLRWVERRALPHIAPHLATSLIVLCDRSRAPEVPESV